MYVPKNSRAYIIVHNPMRVVNAISKKFCENQNYYDGDFTDAIYEHLTIEEAKLLLQTLSKCKCCKRHQKHRPCRLDDFQEDHQSQIVWAINQQQVDDDSSCKCSCRHFSRWICHTFQEEIHTSDA